MKCIEEIVEGQQVVIDNAYRGAGRYSVGIVTKVSKTRVTVSANGKIYQYNRRNGIEIGYGDSWSRWPKIATKYTHSGDTLLSAEEAARMEQEAVLEENKMRLVRAIRDTHMSKFLALSLEELQTIADKIGAE